MGYVISTNGPDLVGQLSALVVGGAAATVLRACHRPCRRLISFDDFCQDVLVRAVQYQSSFRGQTTAELLGWVRAIGQQLLVTLLRRSARERWEPLPTELPDGRAVPPGEQAAAREDYQEKTRWLARVLAELPTDERDLLIRHYYRSEKLADMAHDLGIPANTLAQRHARLLARLRRLR